MVTRILCVALAAPLAVFFAFVGWHKATSPISELAKHGAYTVHLPEWLGRLAGVTEILCAIALIVGVLPRWRRAAQWGAVYVFVSQIIAGTIHIIYGEVQSLPANGLWMAIAVAYYGLSMKRLRE